MAEPTNTERGHTAAADMAAAARDRGMEQLESVKGRLAEGAERVASAVERTADELDGEGDGTISGFGRSLSGLMRQLAGGLRERDVEQFASELGALARRNPAVFLAGSVALGFGVARFFKARTGASRTSDYEWRDRSSGYASDYDGSDYRAGNRDTRDGAGYQYGAGRDPERRWQSDGISREDFDGDESLDLSGNPPGVARREGEAATASGSTTAAGEGPQSPARSDSATNDGASTGSTSTSGNSLRGGNES